MSDTPRTDAALITLSDSDYDSGPFVSPEFARGLERENALLRAELHDALPANANGVVAWTRFSYEKALRALNP